MAGSETLLQTRVALLPTPDFDVEERPVSPVDAAELELEEFLRAIDETGTTSSFLKASPVELRFEQLRLDIERRRWLGLRRDGTQHVLRGVSGRVRPGQLLAILGTSGSGKTSLLNVLMGRIEAGVTSGRVLVNGRPVGESAGGMRRIAGYVMQHDRLFPSLTVRETLTYAAMLRLPPQTSRAERLAQVENVLSELRLLKCADTIIGNELIRGVSGGERRRVSIGVQLLTNPSLLFLDEPTSGLDATTARNIMVTLRLLAKRNRTVVCTIHQPRSDIFRLFDQVMLLSQGQVVYLGPADEMVAYFSRCGYDCPRYTNPADFALDLITVDVRDAKTEIETTERVRTFVDTYETSLKRKQSVGRHLAESDDDVLSAVVPRTPTALAVAAPLLFYRCLTNLRRTSSSLSARAFNAASMAFLLWIFIFHFNKDQVGVQNRIGILYEAVISPTFVGMLNAIAMFPPERSIYRLEYLEGAYGSTAFFLAYVGVMVLFDLVGGAIFSAIIYFGIGFQTDAASFFMFYLVAVNMLIAGESVGCVFCCVFEDVNVANTYSGVVVTLLGILAGFFRSASNFPVVFQWINYLSTVRYSSVIVMTNEFEDITFTCSDAERLPDGTCPTSRGSQILQHLGMHPSDRNFSVGMSVLFTVVYLGVFYAALVVSSPRSKTTKAASATSTDASGHGTALEETRTAEDASDRQESGAVESFSAASRRSGLAAPRSTSAASLISAVRADSAAAAEARVAASAGEDDVVSFQGERVVRNPPRSRPAMNSVGPAAPSAETETDA